MSQELPGTTCILKVQPLPGNSLPIYSDPGIDRMWVHFMGIDRNHFHYESGSWQLTDHTLWLTWYILEIQKMKNCSNVLFSMGNIMRRSKFAYLSWLLRYSAFSVLTKISWLIFHPRCHISWAWLSIFETMCGFGLLHRFKKVYYFWKLTIQQLTYDQNAK